MPSSLNCTPTTPMLSEAVADTAIAPATVAPGAGAVTATVGAVVSVLLTVTVTAADVVVLPAASRATAVSVCVPLTTEVVFQVWLYVLAVSSAPRFAPSTLNWTPTTPTLSAAVAETETALPETVAPAVGAVTDTVGDTVSVPVTVMVALVARRVIVLLE